MYNLQTKTLPLEFTGLKFNNWCSYQHVSDAFHKLIDTDAPYQPTYAARCFINYSNWVTVSKRGDHTIWISSFPLSTPNEERQKFRLKDTVFSHCWADSHFYYFTQITKNYEDKEIHRDIQSQPSF